MMLPDAAALDGVLVVNKPGGVTSSDVVLSVKRLLGARKVGHVGTLDPMATGVLPLCINQATKLAAFFTACEKEYIATLRLGIETDTQDGEGRIVSQTDQIPQDLQSIEHAFHAFRGTVLQTPPMYSAIKHNGVPLYRIARSGGWVVREPREITISHLEILSVALPCVTFQVQCSHGTYVRTLCTDIGKQLGCGAHLVELQRIRNGTFHLHNAIDMDALHASAGQQALIQHIIPLRRALAGVKEVAVDHAVIKKILHGAPVCGADLGGCALPSIQHGQNVKIMAGDEHLIAVVEFLVDSADIEPQVRVWKTLRTFVPQPDTIT
jgi:tRNA pseudouridine55 synthase